MRRRHKVDQPEPVAPVPSPGGARAGLVPRYFGRLMSRNVDAFLRHPATSQIAAVVVASVVVAVTVGVVLGVMLASAMREER